MCVASIRRLFPSDLSSFEEVAWLSAKIIPHGVFNYLLLLSLYAKLSNPNGPLMARLTLNLQLKQVSLIPQTSNCFFTKRALLIHEKLNLLYKTEDSLPDDLDRVFLVSIPFSIDIHLGENP